MSTEDGSSIPAKRYRLKNIETYEVFVDDFDRIEQEASGIGSDLQFATFWLPIGIGAFLTIVSIPNLGIKVYATYLIFAILGLFLGVVHIFKWRRQRDRLKELLNRIRDSQGAPLGEKGDELQPSELANLPSEEATDSGKKTQ